MTLNNQAYKQKLTDKEFELLSSFIYKEFGIKLAPVKKVMLEGRLHKRLIKNNISTFQEYIDLLFSDIGATTELVNFTDVVTTNKTDFFRENDHFEFMSDVVVPEFLANNPSKTFKVWSSAASSGEEPYTIAMVLQEYCSNHKIFPYTIRGTDLSVEILKKAVQAVYDIDRISNLPLSLKQKYFLKSKNSDRVSVRVKKELRNKVSFQRLNLMDNTYDVEGEYDLIFCRNVLIYFDKQTQEAVINKLCKHLKKGGYFFLGHSESVTNMEVPLQNLKPTIFRKI